MTVVEKLQKWPLKILASPQEVKQSRAEQSREKLLLEAQKEEH